MDHENDFVHALPSYAFRSANSIPTDSSISQDSDTISWTSTSPGSTRKHYYYRGNGFSSKACIRSLDGIEYRLVASINKNKPCTIQLHEDKRASTSSLGTVTFPATHNDFQILIPRMSTQMVQVRAKIGYPHPKAYEFSLPSAATTHPRNLTWKVHEKGSYTSGYSLHDDLTNKLIASWTFTPRQKYHAELRWHVGPSNGREEVLIMLSFVGVLSRLSIKGKDYTGLPRGNMARWRGMWYMAILGTAAMM